MNLRDALIQQAPSLALQRAAAAEIARQDDQLVRLVLEVDTLRAAMLATTQALLPDAVRHPAGMARCSHPWPQVAQALWPDAAGAA